MLPAFDLFNGPAGERVIARHGRPAAVVPYGGMPAYESETGTLAVMECVLVFHGKGATPSKPLVLPVSYGMVSLRGRGMVALHDDPAAMWSWRPMLYSLGLFDTSGMGSQRELGYRQGLYEAELAQADIQESADRIVLEQVVQLRRRYGRVPPLTREHSTGFRLGKNARKRLYREYADRVETLNAAEIVAELPFQKANERADRLLRENLSPQQRLDLDARGGFYVRGQINRLYFVELGDGFDIVDPVSHATLISLCLHPEEWIPDADVALATKLAIDSGRDGEESLLAAGRPYPRGPSRRTEEQKAAARLEERWNLFP